MFFILVIYMVFQFRSFKKLSSTTNKKSQFSLCNIFFILASTVKILLLIVEMAHRRPHQLPLVNIVTSHMLSWITPQFFTPHILTFFFLLTYKI